MYPVNFEGKNKKIKITNEIKMSNRQILCNNYRFDFNEKVEQRISGSPGKDGRHLNHLPIFHTFQHMAQSRYAHM